MRRANIAAGLVAGLVHYTASRGADSDALCRHANIDLAALRDPDARIALSAYLDLFEEAKCVLGDPALAVKLGEAIGMSDISVVGLLMEASQTIGDAYLQMQRYGRLAMQMDTDRRGSRFELSIEDQRIFLVDQLAPALEMRDLIESGFAWLVCGPRRYMDRAPVVRIQFTWSKPDYSDEYDRVYRCPIEYGADRNALEMHPESLSWPVGQNPGYVFSMLTERADALLEDLDKTSSTTQQLRGLMASALHRGELTSAACASEMGMSRQTLHRRLSAEGTSYRSVLAELRLSLAEAYLRGGKTSINEIAYLLGFSDTPAFSRAFSRWTGQSPGAFRDRAQSGSGL